MNVITVTGKVVSDAKVINKPGFSIVMFQIENVTGWGEKAKTSILNIKKIGKNAANQGAYIKAGNTVGITGRLIVDNYQQNGATKTVNVIDASDIEFQSNKPKDTEANMDDSGDTNDAQSDSENFFG